MGMKNLSNEELTEALRSIDHMNVDDCFLQSHLYSKAADRIKALDAELDLMKTAGVIEIASRNNRVTEYMFHWEGRALDAEAKLALALEMLRYEVKRGRRHLSAKTLAVLAELEGK